MKMKINKVLLLALSFGVLLSCSEEDLDPTLGQDKSIETSINTANDLQAVLIGAYERLSAVEAYGRDFIILGEVFSDNAASNGNSNRFVTESQMSLTPQSAIASTLWGKFYEVIASANIIINAEGITGDQAAIDHLKGQAYAMRALAHYNLLLFYGQQNVTGGEDALGVPYVTTFRDQENLYPSRNTVGEVKTMAYADLDMAKSLMSADLNDASKEYLTTFAASAIEARIANYFGDWQRSLDAAKSVIDSGQFSVAAEDSFLATFSTDGGANVVWEIAFIATDNPGINGLTNIYQQGSYGDVIVAPNLATLYSDSDIRGVSEYVPTDRAPAETVIGVDAGGVYRNIGKYPSYPAFDDNVPVIRYEEIVLIYAEALLETGNAAEALVQLNKIPANRGAAAYTVASKDNILLERRKELAFEGFRFHDLARTGKDILAPDPTILTHGVVPYGNFRFALPIPSDEADVNANVVQNQGY